MSTTQKPRQTKRRKLNNEKESKEATVVVLDSKQKANFLKKQRINVL